MIGDVAMTARDLCRDVVGERRQLAGDAVGVELVLGKRAGCATIGGVRVRVGVGSGPWLVGVGVGGVVEPVLGIIRVMRKEVVADLIDADDVLFGGVS